MAPTFAVGQKVRTKVPYLNIEAGTTLYFVGTTIFSNYYAWVSNAYPLADMENEAIVQVSNLESAEIVTTPAEQAVYDRIERVLDGYAELTGFGMIASRDDVTISALAALLEAEFTNEV